ncbi:hypothetical protein ACCO45_012215 [Purpureocillium lilacinum]|uniref:Uncharacterized protein n=1 Tax=Purpureocillium lilacinum TaxID=33203 RepID=A0ACC4DD99_PURLI
MHLLHVACITGIVLGSSAQAATPSASYYLYQRIAGTSNAYLINASKSPINAWVLRCRATSRATTIIDGQAREMNVSIDGDAIASTILPEH